MILGAEKIFKELEKPVLVSRSVIYCTRKLAMLQETRRKLIECNAVPVLLSFRVRLFHVGISCPLNDIVSRLSSAAIMTLKRRL